MKKAGFVDVHQQTTIWPLGSWPKQKELKELGRWGKIGMMESASPFALHLLTREGWTQAQVKELVDAMIPSLNNGGYYYQAWFVYGKKPETWY